MIPRHMNIIPRQLLTALAPIIMPRKLVTRMTLIPPQKKKIHKSRYLLPGMKLLGMKLLGMKLLGLKLLGMKPANRLRSRIVVRDHQRTSTLRRNIKRLPILTDGHSLQASGHQGTIINHPLRFRAVHLQAASILRHHDTTHIRATLRAPASRRRRVDVKPLPPQHEAFERTHATAAKPIAPVPAASSSRPLPRVAFPPPRPLPPPLMKTMAPPPPPLLLRPPPPALRVPPPKLPPQPRPIPAPNASSRAPPPSANPPPASVRPATAAAGQPSEMAFSPAPTQQQQQQQRTQPPRAPAHSVPVSFPVLSAKTDGKRQQPQQRPPTTAPLPVKTQEPPSPVLILSETMLAQLATAIGDLEASAGTSASTPRASLSRSSIEARQASLQEFLVTTPAVFGIEPNLPPLALNSSWACLVAPEERDHLCKRPRTCGASKSPLCVEPSSTTGWDVSFGELAL
ncbi:hypothetical protein PAPYR_7352 [Paratrimastix pyriformis]|uniref:Uncharacterized protein n=1 Tax=Paratrimastix pyriformis TaxID=342808 RepID=A0ABQ8UGC1_9EUKA|nr:hypothetical protein PAPYR_7352 [Paratrimastix pyriformis]